MKPLGATGDPALTVVSIVVIAILAAATGAYLVGIPEFDFINRFEELKTTDWAIRDFHGCYTSSDGSAKRSMNLRAVNIEKMLK